MLVAKRDRILGTVQIVLLTLIAEEDRGDTSGEALAPVIQSLVQYIVTPAQIHGALRRLYERGLVDYDVVKHQKGRGRPKHCYRLTKAGVEALENYRALARFIIEKSPSE